MTELALLGATGSIGSQTLDVLRRHRDTVHLCAATCGRNVSALKEAISDFAPAFLGVTAPDTALPEGWFAGEDVNESAVLASGCDTVLCSVVGMAGLKPVMTALTNGKRVLLANKETLVAGGDLVMAAARKLDKQNGAQTPEHMPPACLLPVDSEHSAIFQCMAQHPSKVKRILLTASGGPFRTWDSARIANATPEMALAHPTWRMGGKITIDCASLMNKGLEVIEAYHLFHMPLDRIRVLVHPQSIVHSMVEFEDGSVIAQLANPDMRGPIAYAMGWPDRIESGVSPLELAGKTLTFEEPDTERFPCLALAMRALTLGGGAPCAMNAADEAAVAAFLDRRISFGEIPAVVREVMEKFASQEAGSIDSLIALGQEAYSYTQTLTGGNK